MIETKCGVWSFFECPSCWTAFDLRQIDARKAAICPTCLRTCDAKGHNPADPDGYGSRADAESKANTQHALDLSRVEIEGLQEQVERLTRERDDARIAHEQTHDAYISQRVRADVAEARAEALATALFCPCDDIYCGVHRCVRCDIEIAVDAALAATPPADLTQHPAYRAGVEAAAKACVAEHATQVQAATRKGDRRHDRMLAEERSLVAARLEDEIRALLDTKEVRDGE